MANKDVDISKIQEAPREPLKKPEEVEAPVRVEVGKVERAPEIPKEKVEEGAIAPELPSAPAVSAIPVPIKSAELEKIENILEEDLSDIYFKMPPDQQKAFAAKGEATATEIQTLLGHVKIRVKKILDLIKGWLRYIPGVNRYFLEQEAKIKTDKILKIKEKRESGSNETENKI